MILVSNKRKRNGLACEEPDLNLINLCAINNMRVYHNERQFSRLADLWKAIEDAAASVK